MITWTNCAVVVGASLLFLAALVGNPVTAAQCHYYTGGCGNYMLEDHFDPSPSAADCSAFCEGRVLCQVTGTMSPWGCEFLY